jgi:hypothetical protein
VAAAAQNKKPPPRTKARRLLSYAMSPEPREPSGTSRYFYCAPDHVADQRRRSVGCVPQRIILSHHGRAPRPLRKSSTLSAPAPFMLHCTNYHWRNWVCLTLLSFKNTLQDIGPRNIHRHPPSADRGWQECPP